MVETGGLKLQAMPLMWNLGRREGRCYSSTAPKMSERCNEAKPVIVLIIPVRVPGPDPTGPGNDL